MKIVDLETATTELSALVHDVRSGREPEIVIALDGVPIARLLAYEQATKRQLGLGAGKIWIAPDFDDADETIAELFLGSGADGERS